MKINIIPHPTHPGWYQLVYRPDGAKGKKKYDTAESYEDALGMCDRIQAIIAPISPTPRDTHPRLKDVYEEYLGWCGDGNNASVTVRNKKLIFKNWIIPHFGELRAKDIEQKHFDAFAKKLKGHNANIKECTAKLFAMLRWMKKRKKAPVLPDYPEIPSYHPAMKIIPHPSDLEKVIANLKRPEQRVLFTLMLLTGLRWAEVSRIEWRNIDLKAGTIRLSESETSRDELISIPESLMPWFEAHRGFGFVFLSRRGKPYVSLWKVLQKAAAKVGVKVSPHIFRHASATYLYDATGDIYAVNHHLRHKQLSTSMIYTKMSVARAKRNQDTLVDYLNEKKGKKLTTMDNSENAVSNDNK